MLDVRDYDIAVTERIKAYFNNTHFVMRPTMPIQEIRDRKLLNGEDIEFPIITVRRTNCPMFSKEYNSWSRGRTGQSYINKPNSSDQPGSLGYYDQELASSIAATGHNDAVSVVHSTFELTYYVDVIAVERDNFDTMMVELQENLMRVPYIAFSNMKPDGTIDQLLRDQACHLILEEVEDTSDLENFDSGSALYRATITLKVNAYIYRKYKEKVVENVYLSTKVGDTYVEI